MELPRETEGTNERLGKEIVREGAGGIDSMCNTYFLKWCYAA